MSIEISFISWLYSFFPSFLLFGKNNSRKWESSPVPPIDRERERERILSRNLRGASYKSENYLLTSPLLSRDFIFQCFIARRKEKRKEKGGERSVKMEGTMKNRTHTVRCTRFPKPDSRSLVGRSINYESNGVRCIIGPR